MLAAIVAAAASGANAQAWKVTPSIALESTLTDNVNLTPSDRRKSDWVNELTPGVVFSGKGAHSQVDGRISVPMLIYARTPENNYVSPTVDVSGTLEAVDKFLFIDASANVTPEYLNPFGARSTSLANATQNRYTSQLYRISPYIKGNAGDGVDYELRQSNSWTRASNVSAAPNTDRSYTNEVTAHVARTPQPAGWRFEYDYLDLTFPGQQRFNSETTQIGRGSVTYRPDAAVELAASAGYEDNKFFFTQDSGATYGAAIEWHPTDRTNLSARAEHRFFGTAYHAAFDHHTPHTVWSLSAMRDITSYPQQLATLPAGVDVATMLDALFASRIQDPAQRQAVVDQFIHDRGLPTSLASPVTLFTQQITLAESATGTVGILGARNSIFLTVYHLRNEPIPGHGPEALPPALQQLLQFTNNTQLGTSIVWTHELEPSLKLAVTGNWSRTRDNASSGDTTRLYSFNATLARALSVATSVYAGARYQDSQSDIANDYREAAVFVGINHTFR